MLSRSLVAGLLALGFASPALPQQRFTLNGNVTSADGPVRGANVFLLETLEGAVSDSAGHWSFVTTHGGVATLVVKALGFREVRRAVALEQSSLTITLVLSGDAHRLAPLTTVASRYAASDDRGATLTALDVVTTPGTNADVMRAIQTLPGVQMVDEGTALYVRGGDYTETSVLLNDAILQPAFTYESPNGTFIGTVDPFLLDGIYFSSGGFGARYGNALSGIAALHTLGRPEKTGVTATAGLAALSASAAIAINKQLGIRLATNQFDTDLLFRVNGSAVHYDKPPRGFDRTASAIWTYRPTGEVKAFVIGQRTNLATDLEEASYWGSYTLDLGERLSVVNWRDVFGKWSPSLRLSDSRLSRTQDYGAFRMQTGLRYRGGNASLDWSPTPSATLRSGVEWERNWSEFDGSVPDRGYDKAPGASVTVVGSGERGDRSGVFGEADVLVGARTRVIAGLRQDHATLTGASTIDPRVSTATTLLPGIVLTTAWGIYHQVPDPVLFDSTLGDPTLGSMRASHAIVGLQAGEQGQMIRVEFFDKRYHDLAQLTRDNDVTRDGVGSSRGVDLFIAGSGLPGMRWRMSLSALLAKRTDASTGVLARAPSDVSRSVTTVVQQSLGGGWQLAVSHRYATGRPFTPVLNATHDVRRDVWIPTYGDAMSERLPSFRRVDLGLTHVRRVGGVNAVMFASVDNLFDRENVYTYRYTRDYQSRIPVRSLFKRSFYVGATIATQ
jgi:hypothetical protein